MFDILNGCGRSVRGNDWHPFNVNLMMAPFPGGDAHALDLKNKESIFLFGVREHQGTPTEQK